MFETVTAIGHKVTTARQRAYLRRWRGKLDWWLLPICIRLVAHAEEGGNEFPAPDEEMLVGSFGGGSCSSTINDGIPRIVWIYWHDDHPPVIVQDCIKQIRRVFFDYEVRVFNRESLFAYVGYPRELEGLSPQHMADLFRLEALSREGGVWVDSSVIVYPSCREIVESAAPDEDLVGFYSVRATHNALRPKVETWFMGAPAGTALMQAWRDEYLRGLRMGTTEYLNALRCREDYREIIQGIPDPEYFMLDVALQLVLLIDISFRGRLLADERSAFFIQAGEKWRPHRIARRLAYVPAPSDPQSPPLIKLTSGGRNLAERCIQNGWVKHKSILGRLFSK